MKSKKLIIFSRDEQKRFQMMQEYSSNKFPQIRFIGLFRDKERLICAFKNVDFVIHAAAMKDVPNAEYNPEQCVKTNIDGARNVVSYL